ncbi:MAG TPA: type VI secretion system-associated protein VasI [Marinobacter sp.]|nr:type VI secretion system-associated protein VasI [Marinobacter sp.]
MTLKGQCQCLLAVLLLASSSAWADARLADAEACTQEPNRLQRLACFDGVFGTPAAVSGPAGQPPQLNQSERWRRAFAQAGDEEVARAIYQDTGASAGHLVTVTALGVTPPRPVLTLQCHNNITELALMLPGPLARERVDVTLGASRGQWRVRDDGLVVSAGRGLPAIRIARNLHGQTDLRLSADAPELDGLLFDLNGFSDAIRPLRQACGW